MCLVWLPHQFYKICVIFLLFPDVKGISNKPLEFVHERIYRKSWHSLMIDRAKSTRFFLRFIKTLFVFKYIMCYKIKHFIYAMNYIINLQYSYFVKNTKLLKLFEKLEYYDLINISLIQINK